jgi:asparagine synthase (glutamine-hydrolysing)
LPAQVLRRVSKATPGGFAASLFDANRALIRELLHDGLMAQSGLIDLDAVDQVLRATGPMRGLDHLRLLRLVDIEAWACSWTRPPRGLIQGQSVGHAG